jgi:hypothetical protein
MFKKRLPDSKISDLVQDALGGIKTAIEMGKNFAGHLYCCFSLILLGIDHGPWSSNLLKKYVGIFFFLGNRNWLLSTL